MPPAHKIISQLKQTVASKKNIRVVLAVLFVVGSTTAILAFYQLQQANTD